MKNAPTGSPSGLEDRFGPSSCRIKGLDPLLVVVAQHASNDGGADTARRAIADWLC